MWENRRTWLSYPDEYDRHPIAAIFHLISLFMVMISLVQLSWFEVKGYSSPNIGPKDFLTMGDFMAKHSASTPNVMDIVVCQQPENPVHECVTLEILMLMKILIVLCLVTIFSCMVGFCLDVIGPTKTPLRFVRRNALPSICSVLCIISMIGVSYLLTTSLEMAGHDTHPDRAVQVSYDNGFYVISIAGVFSLVATACNVLQEPGVAAGIPGRSVVYPGTGVRHGSLGRCCLVDNDIFDNYPIHHPPPPPPYSP